MAQANSVPRPVNIHQAAISRRRLLSGLIAAGLAGTLGTRADAATRLPSGLRLEAAGLGFPEGLFRMADGALGCVDIAHGTLLRITPGRGEVTVLARPGPGPNGAALLPDGAVLVADNGGIRFCTTRDGLRVAGLPDDLRAGRIVRVETDGTLAELYDSCDGRPLNGPNDILLDGCGSFWFTDTGKIRPAGQDPGALFHARLDGSAITRVSGALDSPNGLCHGPEGELYIVLSRARTILRLDPGRDEPRVFARLPGTMILDNIVCDSAGHLLIGCVAPGGIACVSPTGVLESLLPLPDFAVTALAFFGKELRRLAVCLSTTGRIVSLPWPVPGRDRADTPAGHAAWNHCA